MPRDLMKQNAVRILPILVMVTCLFLVGRTEAQSTGRILTPRGEKKSLADALSEAQDGDVIEVQGGLYQGPLTINHSVTLIGTGWPVIDGQGVGTTIKITAPGVTLQGFVIRNSGDSLAEENSGIAVEASRVVIEGNRLDDTLFGIYLRQADGSIIRDNHVSSMDLDVPRRGDPIRVWFSKDVLVEDNVVTKGRDVVLWYSERLTLRNNQVSDGRYGLHFMYCDDATIEGNLLTNNSVGTFMMYSRRLHLLGNTIAYNRGPSGFGVGLKDMDDAVVENNLFLDNRVGAHLDNSPREVNSIGRFSGNVFAYNDIGINLMPSVRHNEFFSNSFIDNEMQVGIAGGGGRAENNTWTVSDLGNYWSDYTGYDGNRDGLGDIPYKSERLFENMIDHNSSLRLFLYSPVEQAIDFAARAVPFVKPKPKLTDEVPMMDPQFPAGVPRAPKENTQILWLISFALLALAAALLFWGSVKGKAVSISKAGVNLMDDNRGHASGDL